MKFKTLKGINIYSYLKFFIDFLDFTGSTTIILGKNLDQKTANAAGKTSILKALYWALWNKELDGETIESMICRVAGNGMVVVLEFDDRGNSYKITRWKDHKANEDSPTLHDGSKVNGSGVEFLINGEPFNGESHSQTQKIIEQKLRMTPRLFLSAVLSAQDGTNHFLTANDTDKKELLSELLDLQAYQKAFDNIKKEIKAQEDQLALFESKVENLQEQIKNLEEQVLDFNDKEKAYEEEKVLRLNRLSFERDALNKEIEEIKLAMNQSNPTSEIREKIRILTEKQGLLKKDSEKAIKYNQQLATLEAEKRNASERLVEVEAQSTHKLAEVSRIKSEMGAEVSFNEEPLKNLREKENSLDKELINISSKEREKHSLELTLKSLEQSLFKIDKELSQSQHEEQDVKNNAICSTCKRKFQAGESDSLDELLKTIRSKITEETTHKQEIEKQILEAKNKISTLGSLDEERSLAELSLSSTKTEIKEQEKLFQEHSVSKQKSEFQKLQITSLEKDIASHELSISAFKESIATLITRIENGTSMIQSLAHVQQETEEVNNQIQEQQNLLVQAEVLAQKINDARRRFNEKSEILSKNQKESNDLSKNPNPYTEIISKLNAQKQGFLNKLKGHKEDIIKIQEELKYLNFWRIGFAPTGIRSFITDDVIELLNRKTQENLNDLFDGALSVVFDPESKNNKGVVSNKISTFFILNGKETPFGLLSGGEKRRAILATDLALTDIAEARAGTKLNVRFLDEPFNGIDDNGQIKSLVLFSRLAREKDGFFIISHEEKFQNLCQKALYVIKEREVSRIVDRNTFMSIDIEKQDAFMEDTDTNKHLSNLTKKKKKRADDDE